MIILLVVGIANVSEMAFLGHGGGGTTLTVCKRPHLRVVVDNDTAGRASRCSLAGLADFACRKVGRILIVDPLVLSIFTTLRTDDSLLGFVDDGLLAVARGAYQTTRSRMSVPLYRVIIIREPTTTTHAKLALCLCLGVEFGQVTLSFRLAVLVGTPPLAK
jgi:hypothetical protein